MAPPVCGLSPSRHAAGRPRGQWSDTRRITRHP